MDHKSRKQFRLHWFLLAFVSAIAIRIVIISRAINFYKPDVKLPATAELNGNAIYIQPLTFTPFAPGFAFENSMVIVRCYYPEKSAINAYTNALVHRPIEMTWGSFHYNLQEKGTNFFDANNKRVSKPNAADVPFFVMRVNLAARYIRKKTDASPVFADAIFRNAEFHKLSNSKPTDVLAKEASVRDVSGFASGNGGATKCYWSQRMGPLATDDVSINSGVTRVAEVSNDECWHDPHSRFYIREGSLRTRPNDDTRGDYVMTPHLKLLYDKSNGKLAGGYWWGEFHDEYAP